MQRDTFMESQLLKKLQDLQCDAQHSDGVVELFCFGIFWLFHLKMFYIRCLRYIFSLLFGII